MKVLRDKFGPNGWFNMRNQNSEEIFLGEDLTRHVGNNSRGYKNVNGGQGFVEKNELGITLSEFALVFDLVMENTY